MLQALNHLRRLSLFNQNRNLSRGARYIHRFKFIRKSNHLQSLPLLVRLFFVTPNYTGSSNTVDSNIPSTSFRNSLTNYRIHSSTMSPVNEKSNQAGGETASTDQTSTTAPPAENVQPEDTKATVAKNDASESKILSNSKKHKKKPSSYGKKRDKRKREADAEAGTGGGKPKNVRKTKDWNERNAHRDEVHDGSFANPEMRKLFGVSLPELDNVVDQDSTADAANDKLESSAEASLSEQLQEAEVGANDANEHEHANTDGEETKGNRLPKRKVAILLQFLGTKYAGMQINGGQNSIQAQVELALFKAGCLAKTNFGFPKKYSWSNSARTDKGVHSCAQVCSVKIQVPSDDLEMVRELINEQLPDDIRIADIVRVPRSFCARTQRNKVRYQYILPSFVLQQSEQLKGIFDGVIGDQSRDVINAFTKDETKALQLKLREYRATEENLENLKLALQTYEGTKKFHNYTNGKRYDEANAKRYIVSFKVQDPVVDKYGVEWIPCLVVGQSFLLHQIRKMMSHAMDAARGASSVQTMKKSFEDQYMKIKTAPAQGLFLDMSYYEHFNKRKNAGDPLDWHSDEKSPASLRWKQFKEEKVMSHIMDEEQLQGNFVEYIYTQERHVTLNRYEIFHEK